MTTAVFTAVFERDPESGWYTAWVEEVPGAISQGETLDEARENLHEALAGVLEIRRELAEEAMQGRQVIREPLQLAVA